MCKKTNALLLITMVLIMISLLSALIPVSDFDQDGYLDSLVTEGFLLIPILSSVSGLFYLWIRLPAACLSVPQPFSTLIVPPPIPTE
jgi:hypothetical protein